MRLKLGFVAGFYPLIILMMGTSVALKKVFGSGFGGGMVTGRRSRVFLCGVPCTKDDQAKIEVLISIVK